MTGWLIALCIVILLAILPLGVSVIYNEDGPLVRVIVGFIRLKIFPLKKEKKPKKIKQKSSKITLHTLHHSRLYVPDTKHRSVLTETPKRFGSNAEAFL